MLTYSRASGGPVSRNSLRILAPVGLAITVVCARPVSAQTVCGAPIGSVTAFVGRTVPPGWLLADGAALLRERYEALYAALDTIHGAGYSIDGQKVGDFNLPDLRGRFLRGVDLDQTGRSSGQDPEAASREQPRFGNVRSGHSGNAVGTYQPDAMQSHKHVDSGHDHSIENYRYNQTHDRRERDIGILENRRGRNHPVSMGYADLGDPVDSGSGAGQVRHGRETRPRNIAVMWIICAY